MHIPKEFSNVKHGPVECETVEELIDQLKRLPPDLPCRQGFSDAVRLVVYNVSTGDPHLEFEETDEDFE